MARIALTLRIELVDPGIVLAANELVQHVRDAYPWDTVAVELADELQTAIDQRLDRLNRKAR